MSRVYTIGHSTRSLDDLLRLLQEHEVERLVDVRRFPRSRRHPHFTAEALSESLAAVGIEYMHEPEMGGYRKPTPDSPNTAWRVKGFRAYADHLASSAFREALERLIAGARDATTAIMCAEAVPWRCHRQLISDALVAREHEVVHILGPGRIDRHELNPNARVLEDGRLIYPEEQIELL